MDELIVLSSNFAIARFGRDTDDPDAVSVEITTESSSILTTAEKHDAASCVKPTVHVSTAEREDVLQFLKDNVNNSGVLALLGKYLTSLNKLYLAKWYKIFEISNNNSICCLV